MVTMVLLKVAWICTTPEWTTRFSFFLKLFFLPALAAGLPAALPALTGAFAIRSYVLPVAFFLFATVPRRGPLRVRALVCVRCPRTGRLGGCAQPPVGTHLDVPLDVHRDFFAQVAFDRAFFFQNRTNMVDFVFRQIANFLVEVNPAPVKQRLRTGTADAVDVRKPDLGSLPRRQIHTG